MEAKKSKKTVKVDVAAKEEKTRTFEKHQRISPPYLHSHSRLERDLNFQKSDVLVDEEFGYMFTYKKKLRHKNVAYYIVNILDFVNNGGVFKPFYD